jgi:RimJ/RimL family protein N-acetyltransferase
MPGIDHVGITVSDLGRSLRFYRELLGLTVLDAVHESDADLAALVGLEAADVSIADLATGDGRILELVRFHSPAGTALRQSNRDPGSAHLALAVDDLEATLRRLVAAGVEQLSARPVTLRAPGTSWDGCACVYVRDPDGAFVELVQRPDGVRIEPWTDADLPVLEQTLGDPAMTQHLGGPESPEKIARRHAGYREPGSGQFRIVVGNAREPAGWVGYWEREWRREQVYEIGWSVIPRFQGRGIATAATVQAIAAARADGRRRFLHAFPSVANAASNAVCRKAGFSLLGEYGFEYPPGNPIRCNDWLFDLQPDGGEPSPIAH